MHASYMFYEISVKQILSDTEIIQECSKPDADVASTYKEHLYFFLVLIITLIFVLSETNNLLNKV